MAFDFKAAKDSEVLGRVLEDWNKADACVSPRLDKWRIWYKMYRSYIDSQSTNMNNTANLFIPYVYSIIETVAPRIVKAVFASRPYVGILPVKMEQVEQAEIFEQLIDYQMTQHVGIVAVVTDWIKEALMYGTSILKVGWKYQEKTVIKDEPAVVVMGIPLGTKPVESVEAVADHPDVQHVDLWDFRVAPNAKDIDTAAYAIHRFWADIDALKDSKKYKNLEDIAGNSTSMVESNGASDRQTSIGYNGGEMAMDSDSIEVLEYWTDDWVVAIANRTTVIRSEENPYYHRRKPFVRVVDTPVPHEFYGIGEIEPLEHLQYELNSLRNQRMDNINLILNRMWKVIRGADIDFKQLRSRPGGIIEVDNLEDLEAIELNNVTASSYQEDDIIRRDMDNATGVYDYTRGQTTDRRETATTANILSGNANERFNLKVSLVEDMGIRRLYQLLIQLNQQYFDQAKTIRVLGQDGMSFITVAPEDIAGQYDVMPMGSSVEPLANRQNRMESMVNMYNVLKDNPYINIGELAKHILESSGIKDMENMFISEEQRQQMVVQQAMAQQNAMAQQGGQQQGPGPDLMPVGDGVMQNGEF